jgi:hypothetical protein
VAINNRRDFHAFSALPQLPQSLPAAIGDHERRVDEAFFFIFILGALSQPKPAADRL